MIKKQYFGEAIQGTIQLDGSQNFELSEDIPINFEHTDKFTIAFWIKTDSLKMSAILSKMEDLNPWIGWDILLNDVDDLATIKFQIIHSFPDNCIEVITDASEIIDNKWHHVAVTYNGENKAEQIRFLIDGIERATTIVSDNLTNSTKNSSPITIGSRSHGGCEFQGSVSNLRIYPTSLSNSQIHEIFVSSNMYDEEYSKTNRQSTIILKGVKKEFNLNHKLYSTIYERITNTFKKKQSQKLLALDNVNLEIKQGEMVGIIGRNGSGKTTLLRIMSGVLEPEEGKVIVKGRITPFLALGSGFNSELDAKENIILYGILLGSSKEKILNEIDNILGFAELQDYIDVKLKHFSSGMFMRLAFSVAVSLNPDILMIDEVLAVGDASFQQKSFQKLLSFKKENKTIILVTHDLDTVERLCSKAIFLKDGKIAASGQPKLVVEKYKNSLNT